MTQSSLYLLLAIVTLASAQYYDNYTARINEIANYTFSNCAKLTFTPNYKKVKINILKQTDIGQIVFSDTDLNVGCNQNESVYQKCLSSGALCSQQTDLKSETSYTIGFCAKNVYMYFVPLKDDSNTSYRNMSVTLQARHSDMPCNSIPEDKYTLCGKISPQDCMNKCQLSTIAPYCVYAKCLQNQYEAEKYGFCLPKNLTKEEYMDRCRVSPQITSFNLSTKCEQALPRVIAQGKNNPFVTLLIIAGLLFLISVIYYRYEIKRTGSAPFTPPAICPLWVYPSPPSVIHYS